MAAHICQCSCSQPKRLFQFPCSLTTAPLRRVISWLRQLGARGSYVCIPPPPPAPSQRLSRQRSSVWWARDRSSNLTVSICLMPLEVKGEGCPLGGREGGDRVINSSNYQFFGANVVENDPGPAHPAPETYTGGVINLSVSAPI